jgi:hypothetical protein
VKENELLDALQTVMFFSELAVQIERLSARIHTIWLYLIVGKRIAIVKPRSKIHLLG